MNIRLLHCLREGYSKGWKKPKFRDMVDKAFHQSLDLIAIRLLERSKTANIKRLQEVRGMYRHAKSNYPLLFAIELELERFVALVTVED